MFGHNKKSANSYDNQYRILCLEAKRARNKIKKLTTDIFIIQNTIPIFLDGNEKNKITSKCKSLQYKLDLTIPTYEFKVDRVKDYWKKFHYKFEKYADFNPNYYFIPAVEVIEKTVKSLYFRRK